MEQWLQDPRPSSSETAAKKKKTVDTLLGYFTSDKLSEKRNSAAKKAGYEFDHPLTFMANQLSNEHDRINADATFKKYSVHHMHEYSEFVLRELDRRKRQARQMSFDDLPRTLPARCREWPKSRFGFRITSTIQSGINR